jgi:CHC2 zinc finger
MKQSFYRQRRRQFNPQLLPPPLNYYQFEFPGMIRKQAGWVNVCCCFHEDAEPSLSINLDFGGFRCFSCGEKGGDIVAFHQKRYHLTFVETVNLFRAWEYDNDE